MHFNKLLFCFAVCLSCCMSFSVFADDSASSSVTVEDESSVIGSDLSANMTDSVGGLSDSVNSYKEDMEALTEPTFARFLYAVTQWIPGTFWTLMTMAIMNGILYSVYCNFRS